MFVYWRASLYKEFWYDTATKQRAESKKIDEIKTEDYDILILPGGVKAMEKVRQEKKLSILFQNLIAPIKQLHVFVVEHNF